jgi:hypothetical protein
VSEAETVAIQEIGTVILAVRIEPDLKVTELDASKPQLCGATLEQLILTLLNQVSFQLFVDAETGDHDVSALARVAEDVVGNATERGANVLSGRI